MTRAEYTRLTKEFNRLTVERRYAESNREWDTVGYLDEKRESIIKTFDNAEINFPAVGVKI
jgi:hypothetical protein